LNTFEWGSDSYQALKFELERKSPVDPHTLANDLGKILNGTRFLVYILNYRNKEDNNDKKYYSKMVKQLLKKYRADNYFNSIVKKSTN
jgi:hypothetical protein